MVGAHNETTLGECELLRHSHTIAVATAVKACESIRGISPGMPIMPCFFQAA